MGSSGIFLSKVQLKRNWQHQNNGSSSSYVLCHFCRCFCSERENKKEKKRKSRCLAQVCWWPLDGPADWSHQLLLLMLLLLLRVLCWLYWFSSAYFTVMIFELQQQLKMWKLSLALRTFFTVIHSGSQHRIHFQIFCSRNFHERG